MTQADSVSQTLGRSLEETPGAPSRSFRPFPAPAYSPFLHTPSRRGGPTVQEDPISLTDPLEHLEPVPVEGCRICAALGRQRAEAREAGDLSKVSDCNVEIYLHPHPKKRRGRG
jgi:hypothetical protein